MTQEATEKLTPLTLSTGIMVQIRKVSPYTLDAVRRAIPAPQPPMQSIDYGDGDVRQEPNEADPGYQRQIKEHQQAVALKAQEFMLSYGVVINLDDAARAQLEALREVSKTYDIEIDKDDKLAYVKHIAVRSEDDLTLIAATITSKSQPTEEAVQQHLDTFPGDGAGAGSL